MTPPKPAASVHLGEKIEVKNTFLGKQWVGKIVTVINAILRIQVKTANGMATCSIAKDGGLLIDFTNASTDVGDGTGMFMIFKGEWINGSSYDSGHVVRITGGLTAGTYISLIDNNTSLPYNSITWSQLANNKVASNWL